MNIKNLFYKIKEDLKSLFKYPQFDFNDNLEVNYDKYWEKRGRNDNYNLSEWQRKRADIVLRYIEKGSSLLDLGCGNGAILKYFQAKAGIKGIGIDLSEKMLKQAEMLGVQTIKMDINKPEETEKLPVVDYITGFEIIEHLPFPEKLLTQLKLKARKGMFFSIPNTGYYTHRLRLLLGRFPLQWASHPGEHARFWTVVDLKWWVKSLGLDLEFCKPYEGVPLLNKIFPRLFAQGMIFKISIERKKAL